MHVILDAVSYTGAVRIQPPVPLHALPLEGVGFIRGNGHRTVRFTFASIVDDKLGPLLCVGGIEPDDQHDACGTDLPTLLVAHLQQAVDALEDANARMLGDRLAYGGCIDAATPATGGAWRVRVGKSAKVTAGESIRLFPGDHGYSVAVGHGTEATRDAQDSE
jgi:hypothetical protein